MKLPAKLFISAVLICGIAVVTYAAFHTQNIDYPRFAAFLLIALLAARLKVALPGVDGTMSVNLPFILLAISDLSLMESLVIACASTVIQCFWNSRKQSQPIQILFNLANVGNATWLAYMAFHPMGSEAALTRPLLLAAAAATYFLANTGPVAAIIALTEAKNVAKVWYQVFLWTFPYYLASAGLASLVSTASQYIGWQTPLIVLPVMFALYCSYKKYFAHSEANEKDQDLAYRAAAAQR